MMAMKIHAELETIETVTPSGKRYCAKAVEETSDK
jgi:hypothetical protein